MNAAMPAPFPLGWLVTGAGRGPIPS